MQIVQISGKAGVGKSSFARELYMALRNDGKKCLIINYGDRIKEIARQIYGWNGLKDEIGRKILQNTGDQGRKIDKLFWIKEVHNLIKFVEKDYDYIIIADCRMINEIEYWKDKTKYESIAIRLKRENFVSNLTEEAQKHSTEIDLDNYKSIQEFIVSGELEKLTEEANKFIDKYLKGGEL